MNIRTRFVAALAILAIALVPMAASAADTGSANFTRYVALGDSLTAGFCSGGLVRNCQLGSYPLLIFAAYFLLIMAQISVDPTSHNLWPLELAMIAVVGLPVVGVLWLVRLVARA